MKDTQILRAVCYSNVTAADMQVFVRWLGICWCTTDYNATRMNAAFPEMSMKQRHV